jgi:hypothetical protein
MNQLEIQVLQHDSSNPDAKLAQLQDDWSRLRDHRVEASRQALAIYRDHQNVTNFKQIIHNNQSNHPYRTLESIYLESIQFQQRQQVTLLQNKEQIENVSNQSESRRARKRRRRRPGRMAPIIPKGMPVGVGDCCATKLLAFCSHYNRHSEEAVLKPVGIAEVFFGTSRQTQQARDPKSLLNAVTTKTDPAAATISGRSKQVKTLVQNDGTFFDACTLRCQPVLGFLLCGLDNMSQAMK